MNIEQAKLLYCDNMSAIALSKNLEHHARTKHINVQFYFVRYYIKQKIIDLKYICTKKQLVDAFTKTIIINNFRLFCKKINLIDLWKSIKKNLISKNEKMIKLSDKIVQKIKSFCKKK